MKALFRPVPKPLVSDHIAAELEEAITHGSIPPGGKLLLGDLARQFEVSIIPVREALNRLSAKGLITRKPNLGTFVVELTLPEMQMILEVRIPMEGLAARLAVDRRTSGEIAAMRRAVACMGASLEKGDHRQYSLDDLEFHRTLWASAHNPFLEKSLATLMMPWFGYQLASGIMAREQDHSMIPVLHGRVVDAIESGTPNLAERSISELSTCAGSYIGGLLEQS